jgi:hypothetical protein
MIYELRTYTLVPGAMGEYLRLQREIGRGIRGDRYGTLVGCWTTEFGTLNRYVHLWSYQDAGERQRLRVALMQNPAWRNEFMARTPSLVLSQENALLLPVDGVPVTPPGGDRHVYELRSYRAQYQRAPEWLEHFTAVLPVRQTYSPLVGLWTTDAGPLNGVVHLWAYSDLHERADARARALQDPRWQEYLANSTPALVEQHSIVLIPTDFSPLR